MFYFRCIFYTFYTKHNSRTKQNQYRQMDNIDIKSFFDNNESYTSFERKRILSDLTDGFDLNLLTEFSNSFVQHCFSKFNQINYSLPKVEMIEKKEGDIYLNEFHFPFYEIIQNEIQKEVRIETFNNISYNDCLNFNSFMNTFIDEIENIIENQNIKIHGIKITPEAVIPDEVLKKELYNHIFKGNAFEVFEKYHSTKRLAENSKTDLNLLFQLFENDNLFVETVELKHYIKWLNSKFEYSLTELKKVNINSKPNIQRANDYKEYKKLTLKQP